MNRIFLTLLFSLLFATIVLAKDKVVVFAASSTTNALEDIIFAYNKVSKVKVVASYAGSGTLAKQIENSAPTDIFISASEEWVDYLQKKSIVKNRVNLLGNSLVLIANKDHKLKITEDINNNVFNVLNGGKLALGTPESVPAGAYAKEALIHLDDWMRLQKSLIFVENVRIVLALVERGEVALGIVFNTDYLVNNKNLISVSTIPSEAHSPIIYPAAIVSKSADDEEVKKFFTFLKSETSKNIFIKHGFKVL